MFDVGAAGYTIVAVSATAGLAVIGFILAVYGAHCFLTVVIDSGCGIDEVRWPGEGVFDWVLKPVYCAWLLIGWAVLFGVVLLPLFLRDALSFGIALAVALYAIFPITLLSSLTAKSWVALMHPPFLRRFARWPLSYVTTLVLGAPLAVAAVAVTALAAVNLWWVFLAAPALPVLLLWYARLLGRYGWLVTHTPLRTKKPSKPAPTEKLKVKIEDPWAVSAAPVKTPAVRAADAAAARNKYLPPEALERLDDELAPADSPAPVEDPVAAEDEWTIEKKPYAVMDETQERQSWQERRTEPLEDVEGYGVDAAAQTPLATPFSLTAYYDNYLQEEEKRRQRTETAPPPRPTFGLAFGKGLFLFPFYHANLKTWINLGLLTLAALFFLRMIVIAGSVILG